MPLAGNMKLNQFLALVGISGLMAAGGAWYLISEGPDVGPDSMLLPESKTVDAGTEVRPGVTLNRDLAGGPGTSSTDDGPAGGAAAPATVTGTADEQMVMSWKAKPLVSSKKKDVSKGYPFKINVYQDEPGLGVNRAKVDLDRDDQWDQKYTFEPDGGVTRKVAPADDENYSVRQRWDGNAWVDES